MNYFVLGAFALSLSLKLSTFDLARATSS